MYTIAVSATFAAALAVSADAAQRTSTALKLSRARLSGSGDVGAHAYSRLSFGRIGAFTRARTVVSPLVSC